MITGEWIHLNPSLDAPPWLPFRDQSVGMGSAVQGIGVGGGVVGECHIGEEALAGLYKCLPSNEEEGKETEEVVKLADPPVDTYSCDEFRIYEFKVRRCARGRSHDWTECPFAHPGEKARRRDPRKYHYSGTSCPDFRKGSCKKGDYCEFAHGVFECWLHPARYRTQPCKDGTACRRRVCFFAHTSEQLRVLPHQQQPSHLAMDSYGGSSLRNHPLDAYFPKGMLSSSPNSTLNSPTVSPPADSPPMSPDEAGLSMMYWPVGTTVTEVVASLRKLQLSKVKSMPSSCALQLGGGVGSPNGMGCFGLRQGLCSMPSPSTPTEEPNVGVRWLGLEGFPEWEEPAERVESGRALRAKMYERLSKESGVERPGAGPTAAGAPDVGWVSELVN